ncbi:20789_t:CDS:2, partial [Gigaspora rosea]
NILEPFDQLTTYLSGMQYTTLLVVNSSIEALKYQYAREVTLSVDKLNQIWNNYEELRSDNESNSSHSKNESESDGEHFVSSHKHNTRSKKHESSPMHSINAI